MTESEFINPDSIIAAQAAEISRLTAAERLLRALFKATVPSEHPQRQVSYISGNGVLMDEATAAEIVAFCAPQPQPAQAEPETPVLSRYAADIAALAAGEITESEFFERQGRRPI